MASSPDTRLRANIRFWETMAVPFFSAKLRWAILSLCVPLFVVFYASAQQSAIDETGLKQYGSYHGGQIDSINMVNLKPTIVIPLVSYPQRGGQLPFIFNLIYHPPTFTTQIPTDPTPCDPPVNGKPITWQNCHAQYYYTFPSVGDFTYPLPMTVEPSFMEKFWCDEQVSAYCSAEDGGGLSNHHADGYTDVVFPDATGLSLTGVFPTELTVVKIRDAHGVLHQIPSQLKGQTSVKAGELTTTVSDLNGNSISAATDNNQTLITSWTDTVGRSLFNPMAIYQCKISTCSSATKSLFANSYTTDFTHCTGNQPITSAFLWSVPSADASGTAQYKFCLASVPYSTSLCGVNDPTHCLEAKGKLTVIQSIVLPDPTSSAWTFNYDPSSGYADLQSIGLPTGGSITYTYANYSHCGVGFYNKWFPVTRAARTRTRTLDAADGTGAHTWMYSQAMQSNGIDLTTTVTDPTPFSDVSVHTLNHLDGYCSLYETRLDQYQGAKSSANLLKTTATVYNYAPASVTNPLAGAINVTPKTVTTAYPNGKTSQVATTYDSSAPNGLSYGDVLTRSIYDFGSGAPGPLISRTNYSYQWSSASSSSAYLSANILDHYCPAISQIESAGCLDGVNRHGNRMHEAPVKWGFSQRA